MILQSHLLEMGLTRSYRANLFLSTITPFQNVPSIEDLPLSLTAETAKPAEHFKGKG